MQTTQVKHYDIYGVVFNAACRMPTEQRNDPWLVCSVIVSALDEYFNKLNDAALAEYCKPDLAPTPPRDVFDTEHTDDIPKKELFGGLKISNKQPARPKKPRKTFVEYCLEQQKPNTFSDLNPTDSKTESVADPEPEPDLPPFTCAHQSGPVDLEKNYLGQYSNPCSTQVGKCLKPCVQTELWLFDKDTDYMSVVDVEYENIESLRATLDPYVAYAKKHRHPPQYIDTKIAAAQEKIVAECREYRKNHAEMVKKLTSNRANGKTQMERFVELYNAGFKYTQIANELGITVDSVYAYKHKAKKEGLIK